MIYYHCSGSLQFLPPANHLSTSLQEFIKLERSHESSFRAWNQDFLAANVALNSWALSESSTDRETLETLTQISKLLSNSASAQNQYATALADYRTCLKQTLNKETELQIIKRDREILLKRFLKLNRRSPITPSNNLNFRIKLDDAKRELAICQRTLRATADQLHESKQNCLREALRAKLAKYEDLGQAIKLNAQQAIQLIDRTIPDNHTSETESEFKSCDQDSVDETTLQTPPPIGHDQNPWAARSHSKREDASNSLDIKSLPRPSGLGSQRGHSMDRPSASNHPAGLHIYSGSRHPNHSKQPLVPGTALMPPPRVLVRKRNSTRSRQARMRAHARDKQPSPLLPHPPRTHRKDINAHLGRTHIRQRSQSLDLQRFSNTLPRETFKARKLIRPVSHRLQASRITSNPLNNRSLGHLPSTDQPPVTNESVSSFKFFPKNVISKLGGIKKKKDEKIVSAHDNQPNSGGQTGEVESLQTSQEHSFWPTIQPLSLYSDTCSDDAFSDDEQHGGEEYQSEDEFGSPEYQVPSSQTLRPGIRPTGIEHRDSSAERLPKKLQPVNSLHRRHRPNSWNNIPKQSRMGGRAERMRRVRASRNVTSALSDDESSDSEDRSGHITLNEDFLPTSTVESGSRRIEQENPVESMAYNSPLSRIKEYDGSSTSESAAKKLETQIDLLNSCQHHHHLGIGKYSESSVIHDERSSTFDHQRQGPNQFTIDQPLNHEKLHDDQSSHQRQHQHHHDTCYHDEQENNGEFKLQTHTQKAMGDIKAKFFALGMQSSASSS